MFQPVVWYASGVDNEETKWNRITALARSLFVLRFTLMGREQVDWSVGHFTAISKCAEGINQRQQRKESLDALTSRFRRNSTFQSATTLHPART
jgi:hypothetical protein